MTFEFTCNKTQFCNLQFQTSFLKIALLSFDIKKRREKRYDKRKRHILLVRKEKHQ